MPPDGGEKQQVIRPDGGKPPLPGLLGGERRNPHKSLRPHIHS